MNPTLRGRRTKAQSGAEGGTVTSIDFVVPGDIETPTGGYIYDREIIAGLTERGVRVALHSLDASFPSPTPSASRAARATFAAIPAGRVVVIDGLALPGLDRLLADEARRLKLVALVHHPVALETGLDAETAERIGALERRALTYAQRVITTSQWTARTLATDGVPVAQLRVVEPGVDRRKSRGSSDPKGAAALSAPRDTVNLLCVGTLTLRKGHAVLLEALNEIRDRHWHLTCAGSLLRDLQTVAAIQHQIDRLSLRKRVSLLGDLDRDALERQYARADVFVLPSYLEGYGMALAEAVAFGLPVVSTTAGAIPETVPANASLLVAPGDSRALAKALASVVDDPARRATLAANARAARASLPTWATAAGKFATALDGLGAAA
jgi:glycosyltransferase involved in cell wall biosynthesis